MDKREEGYDLIRTIAILIVFLGHILGKQSNNETVLLAFESLSPGLTMSLLGFISAVLLSAKKYDFGSFLVKRFTRIYISLLLCLSVVLIAHSFLGKNVITQHTLLHLMGLSAFFELFLVENKSTIGGGLWFITAIVLMYLVFPLLQDLFRHRRGLLHLVLFVLACTLAHFVMYGTQSIWNVIISFSVGVYLGVNGHTGRLSSAGAIQPLVFALFLITIAVLSTASVIPYSIRGLLFALYPLAFVPLLIAISRKLPRTVLYLSNFFAGLSYEFYILHFYLINEGFADFFPASTPIVGQIFISFCTTFIFAYIISRIALRTRKVIDRYLLNI
jgi:peptidoglycan/LPS O-acetylase OafA/YrhL